MNFIILVLAVILLFGVHVHCYNLDQDVLRSYKRYLDDTAVIKCYIQSKIPNGYFCDHTGANVAAVYNVSGLLRKDMTGKKTCNNGGLEKAFFSSSKQNEILNGIVKVWSRVLSTVCNFDLTCKKKKIEQSTIENGLRLNLNIIRKKCTAPGFKCCAGSGSDNIISLIRSIPDIDGEMHGVHNWAVVYKKIYPSRNISSLINVAKLKVHLDQKVSNIITLGDSIVFAEGPGGEKDDNKLNSVTVKLGKRKLLGESTCEPLQVYARGLADAQVLCSAASLLLNPLLSNKALQSSPLSQGTGLFSANVKIIRAVQTDFLVNVLSWSENGVFLVSGKSPPIDFDRGLFLASMLDLLYVAIVTTAEPVELIVPFACGALSVAQLVNSGFITLCGNNCNSGICFDAAHGCYVEALKKLVFSRG